MGLSAAFHNASSGLTVALKAVGATSSNLANALSENYGRREVTISSRTDGGARVTDVSRQVNQRALGQLWLANSTASGHEHTLNSLEEIDRLIGDVNDPGSLFDLTTKFEASLISLASRPDESVRQDNMSRAAERLASKFHLVGKGIQEIRTGAETQISRSVAKLNGLLEKIEGLNGSIAKSHGMNTASLEDERQSLIEKVSDIIPVKQVSREYGRIALMTPKGQFLVDQSAALLSFDAVGIVTQHHAFSDGTLSAPTLNGGPLHVPLGGGLASLLNIRDTQATNTFEMINDLAVALSSRLSESVDGGPLFSLSTETPLPIHMQVSDDANDVDPNIALTALNNTSIPFSDLVASMSSDFSARILDAEDQVSSSRATHEALVELTNENAVDSDTELQNLIHIEKVYAANAKALQVVGNMLDDLLKIG